MGTRRSPTGVLGKRLENSIKRFCHYDLRVNPGSSIPAIYHPFPLTSNSHHPISSMTTTTRSVDVPHVHLDPRTPAAYLRRLIIRTCNRKGADGAEAGVIAEMERLLEQRELPTHWLTSCPPPVRPKLTVRRAESVRVGEGLRLAR